MQQNIERPKMHVKDELFQRPVQHWPAPRHRLVTFEEHADGNHLDEPARRAPRTCPCSRGASTAGGIIRSSRRVGAS